MNNAREVKDRLRRRYPASDGQMPGAWTVLEEYSGIDVLAFCAWSHAAPARRSNTRPIIGHEVKVSRGDYRRELLRPDKRARHVARCTEFYFVTPKGLLSDEERAYQEPEHFEGQAFERERCPVKCQKASRYERPRGVTGYGRWEEYPTAYGERVCSLHSYRPDGVDEGRDLREGERRSARRWVPCETCGGRGYLRVSVVEQEAPTLWIPRDVGLIEVSQRGCSVVRKAPVNNDPSGGWGIGQLVRWVSMRPDPRHHQERAGQRDQPELQAVAA